MRAPKLLISFILFFVFGGIIAVTGCDFSGSNTLPAIELDTTAGQVVLGDTVTITGKVVQGSKAIKDLVVLNDKEQKVADVPFSADGSFSYVFTLGEAIFSTCNFRVRDVNYLSNRERITFIRGNSSENMGYPAQNETVNEAANILVNEDFVNNIVETAVDIINNELPEAIDQVIPFTATIPASGIPFVTSITATVNDFQLGNISLGPVLLRDNEEIVATDVLLEGFSIDGQMNLTTFLFGNVTVPFHAVANVSNISLDEFKMKVLFDEKTNNIVLKFDGDDLDAELFNQLQIDLEIAGLPPLLSGIMSWAVDLLKNFVGVVFRTLFDTISIPIMNVNDLAMSLDLTDLGVGLPDAEIFGAIWFPTGYLYETNPNCSNCGEMYIQPGIALKPVSQNPLNPNLDHFYATPDSGLPVYDNLSFAYGNHNLSVGVNDDMVNMSLFAAIQSGMFNQYDVSPLFEAEVKKVVQMEVPQVLISMNTPPVADWSGPAISHTATAEGDSVYAGKYLVRNLVIEIKDKNATSNIIRISVDVDAAMNFKVSQDGTYIEAVMDREKSDFNIGYLYLLNGDLTVLGNLAEDITLYVVELIIGSMIKIDVPSADLYGKEIIPHLYKAEVGENTMVLWLGMERL